MGYDLPKLIFITGVDGAGKSCLSKWLSERLNENGLKVELIWSRFNNYFSKPLLGLSRLTGHNYYKNVQGTLFGFHDFEKLKVFRELFAFLQGIDVNIGTLLTIGKAKRRSNYIICERGPWDTIVDVISDTGLDLTRSLLCRFYTTQIRNDSKVFLINRSRENILKTRPDLIHDKKLMFRIGVYEKLAKEYGWSSINNNETLEKTKKQISQILNI